MDDASQVRTVDPISGRSAQRETNTMPQWAGSCWCVSSLSLSSLNNTAPVSCLLYLI